MTVTIVMLVGMNKKSWFFFVKLLEIWAVVEVVVENIYKIFQKHQFFAAIL